MSNISTNVLGSVAMSTAVVAIVNRRSSGDDVHWDGLEPVPSTFSSKVSSAFSSCRNLPGVGRGRGGGERPLKASTVLNRQLSETKNLKRELPPNDRMTAVHYRFKALVILRRLDGAWR